MVFWNLLHDHRRFFEQVIENTFRYQVFFAVCGRDEVGESSDVADAAAIETFGATSRFAG